MAAPALLLELARPLRELPPQPPAGVSRSALSCLLTTNSVFFPGRRIFDFEISNQFVLLSQVRTKMGALSEQKSAYAAIAKKEGSLVVRDLIDVITPLVARHQEARSKVTDEQVRCFMTPRCSRSSFSNLRKSPPSSTAGRTQTFETFAAVAFR